MDHGRLESLAPERRPFVAIFRVHSQNVILNPAESVGVGLTVAAGTGLGVGLRRAQQVTKQSIPHPHVESRLFGVAL
jgi:hypothetical protein